MSLGTLQKIPGGRKLLWQLASGRASGTVAHFQQLLQPGEALLDIGAGICDVTLRLHQAGFNITALDVAGYSATPLITPQLYNGKHMPFKNRQFDTALLLTVLHHIPASEQETVLREAGRVANRIIIIEDVYTGRVQRLATWLVDSLLNLEFFGHPHSNRTAQEWETFFKELGWHVAYKKSWRSLGVLHQRMYVLGTGHAGKPHLS